MNAVVERCISSGRSQGARCVTRLDGDVCREVADAPSMTTGGFAGAWRSAILKGDEPMQRHHDVVWTREKIGAFWDFVSSTEAQAKLYFSHIAGNGVVRHLAETVDLRGRRVLDFGCGPGHLFPHLVRHAPTAHYFGVDFSPNSVDELTRRWGGHPQFDGGAAIDSFPFGLESLFDVVVCCEVIEHLDDPTLERVCQTFATLLRPGGKLYLATPNAEDLAQQRVMCPDCGGVFHRWQHMRSWTARSLVAQMSRHQFIAHQTQELVYAESWTKTRLLTGAGRVLGQRMPNLCYVGVRS